MKSFFDPSFYEQTGVAILGLQVQETPTEYILSLLAPGLNRKEIELVFSEDNVTITNKTRQSLKVLDDPSYTFSGFSRSFTIPYKIEKGKTRMSYKNDLITITLIKLRNECRDLPLTKSTSHPLGSGR
jgi:HSP20 family protein